MFYKMIGWTIGLAILTITGSVWAATISYSYDQAGRLIKAAYSTGLVIEYSYDPAGNLLQRTVTVNTAQAETGHGSQIEPTGVGKKK